MISNLSWLIPGTSAHEYEAVNSRIVESNFQFQDVFSIICKVIKHWYATPARSDISEWSYFHNYVMVILMEE